MNKTTNQTPPKFKKEVTMYEYTKYSILKELFENNPMPTKNLYSFIDKNETNFAFPPEVLSFEYINVLLESNIIIKKESSFELTQKGYITYEEIKKRVEL